MPMDEAGNRADIVMDANSTISRMNLARLYEQYTNAASRDVVKHCRARLGLEPSAKGRSVVQTVYYENRALFEEIYAYLMGYYQITSPKMYMWFTSGIEEEDRVQHLARVIDHGIYLYIPPDNPTEPVEMVKAIEAKYRPTYGPVTYIGNSGNKITTNEPVRIGSVYMMLLEKIADDGSAVSSSKLQNFGILAKLSKADKNAQPVKNQAVKIVGETEGRILATHIGQKPMAEIMDRNNNPITHKHLVWNLLNADNPANVDSLVDRSQIPYNQTKPLQLVNHIAACSGYRYKYFVPPAELKDKE